MNPEYQRRAQALEAALRIAVPGKPIDLVIADAAEILAFLTEGERAPAPTDDPLPL